MTHQPFFFAALVVKRAAQFPQMTDCAHRAKSAIPVIVLCDCAARHDAAIARWTAEAHMQFFSKTLQLLQASVKSGATKTPDKKQLAKIQKHMNIVRKLNDDAGIVTNSSRASEVSAIALLVKGLMGLP